MIKKISIKNFYSIGEEQELSVEIGPKDILDDSAKKMSRIGSFNLVSCVIGHNASGKTNVLKAITFLFWLINQSYTSFKSEDRIPYEQHKLLPNQSSQIMIEFFDKEVFYEYLIEFDQKKILKERLRKKVMRMTSIFELERDSKSVKIKTTSLKLNKTDEARFKERHNVALLSSLIDTGYLSEITLFKNFESNVRELRLMRNNVFPDLLNVSQAMYEDKSLSQEILNFVKGIDLGLSDFQFGEIRPTMKEDKPEKILQVLECIHETKNGNFILPIFRESDGTQHGISLLSKILLILKNGGLLVLDEIESGLHPYVVKKLISLFESKQTNPNGGQLIFSTHQHMLLNDRTKTQIFIAEKNEETLETEVYRLDEVEGVRNDENYFHKYIAGTYGGTPRFDWM